MITEEPLDILRIHIEARRLSLEERGLSFPHNAHDLKLMAIAADPEMRAAYNIEHEIIPLAR